MKNKIEDLLCDMVMDFNYTFNPEEPLPRNPRDGEILGVWRRGYAHALKVYSGRLAELLGAKIEYNLDETTAHVVWNENKRR